MKFTGSQKPFFSLNGLLFLRGMSVMKEDQMPPCSVAWDRLDAMVLDHTENPELTS